MPFYEYECTNCKFYVEALQKISDEPIRKCPSCGKKTMKKLVSAPVFRLKGEGWYETDFKSDDDKKRNLAQDEPAPEAAKVEEIKKDEPKADAKAKPEAKPEAKSSTAKKSATKPAAKAAAKAPAPKAKPKAKSKPAKKK